MTDTAHVALLLEDEPLIAMDIEQLLAAAGFRVTSLATCTQASEWLRSHRPDVAVVDIELRDGSCHQVAAQLHEQRVPFLVHSGDIPGQHRNTPFAQGAWVAKPCAPDDFRAALHEAMAARYGSATPILA